MSFLQTSLRVLNLPSCQGNYLLFPVCNLHFLTSAIYLLQTLLIQLAFFPLCCKLSKESVRVERRPGWCHDSFSPHQQDLNITDTQLFMTVWWAASGGSKVFCRRSVWQVFLLCVNHSTWPVWRHQGRRQISCLLMSACRRIPQVTEHLFFPQPFTSSLSFSFNLAVALCRAVITPLISFLCTVLKTSISLDAPYLLMRVCFFFHHHTPHREL